MSVSSGLVNGLLSTLTGLNDNRLFEVVISRYIDGKATVTVQVEKVLAADQTRFEGYGLDSEPEQARVKAIINALSDKGFNLPA